MKLRAKFLTPLILCSVLLGVAGWKTFQESKLVARSRQLFISSQDEIFAITTFRARTHSLFLDAAEKLFMNHETDSQWLDESLALAEKSLEDYSEAKLREMNIERDYGPAFSGEAHQADIAELRLQYLPIKRELKQIVLLGRHGAGPDIARRFNEVRERLFQDRFIGTLSRILDHEMAENKQNAEDLRRGVEQLSHWVLWNSAAVVLLLFGMGWLLITSIVKRLSVLETATRQIAKGNLCLWLPVRGNDEISSVSRSFNSMSAGLLDAQEKLEEQQKAVLAASKLSVLGEMAAGIAHEINNPVATIGLLAGQLHDALNSPVHDPRERAELAEMAHSVETSAARIAKIVQGLKTFSREGASDPFETADLRKIVDDTLALCKERFGQHGVQLRLAGLESERLIECRPTQISQVLLNLLGNAFDATQPLAEKWIEIAVSDHSDHTVVSVTDSGRGIPSSVRGRVFQPFVTTKNVGCGTGLGLSISRGLIESHGGTLSLCENSPHTRFEIRIPKTPRHRTS